MGNYQLAINEASSMNRLSDDLKIEKETFVYRSYVALGQYSVVLDEVKDEPTTPTGLRAVKLLATYLSDPSQKDASLQQLKEWQTDPQHGNNATLQIVASLMYGNEGDFKSALAAVRNGTTLEQQAVTVQLMLRLDRLDLAKKLTAKMNEADEEASLAQMSTAWVNCRDGGNKSQDAAYLFQELGEKFGASSLLLNGQAVASMQQGNFEEAERLLMEAQGKNSNDPDTITNQIVCAQHLNKDVAVVNRYISQLKRDFPNHAWVTALATQEGAFERVAAGFA
jgi:coatomer protein complex subunit epsilon